MGIIYFAKNFTESLTVIRDEGRNAAPQDFLSSEVHMFMQ